MDTPRHVNLSVLDRKVADAVRIILDNQPVLVHSPTWELHLKASADGHVRASLHKLPLETPHDARQRR